MNEEISRAEENKRKREHWSSHIERWQESGLSQSQYCKEHGLRDHQFTYWKKRMVQTETAAKFVSLNLSSFTNKQPPQPGSSLRVVVSNGLKVEVEAGFDPHLLGQLIIALRAV
jgi:hypothetical protein